MKELIEKYMYYLKTSEYNMLQTLLRYNLLLDLKEDYTFNYKRLIGYNLERQVIFCKEIKEKNRKC